MCLMLLSTCCEDDVVPHVLPFIREHIENPDWRYRDASVMAFGSILEGPELNQLKTLVIQVRAPPTTHPTNLSMKLLVVTLRLLVLVLQSTGRPYWPGKMPEADLNHSTATVIRWRTHVASVSIHNEAKLNQISVFGGPQCLTLRTT